MDDDKLHEESEERPQIKVTDRRKFTADGTLRDTASEADEPASEAAPEATAAPDEAEAAPEATAAPDEAEAAPEATAAPDEAEAAPEATAAPDETEAAPDPAAAQDAAVPPDSAGAPQAPAAAEDPDEDPRIVAPQPSLADLPRDFGAFVETLYLEAMLYLGAIPDPRSGQLMEDLELSKYKIDLLGMLQDKTQGNLSTDEKQQLDEVLYQLRMLYLQKTQAPK